MFSRGRLVLSLRGIDPTFIETLLLKCGIPTLRPSRYNLKVNNLLFVTTLNTNISSFQNDTLSLCVPVYRSLYLSSVMFLSLSQCLYVFPCPGVSLWLSVSV